MYKSLVLPVFFVFSLLVMSGQLLAEERIGVVDWRVAIFQSDAAKKADVEMKVQNKQVLDRIRVLEGKLESTRKKMEKDKDLLSESDVKTMEREFQRDISEFNVLRARLQEVQIATETRFISSQKEKIDNAMQKLAKKHNLTLVLDRQTVVYSKSTVELTQELVDALNAAP